MKKNVVKRILTVGVMSVMIIGSLVGCGNKDEETVDSNSVAVTASSNTEVDSETDEIEETEVAEEVVETTEKAETEEVIELPEENSYKINDSVTITFPEVGNEYAEKIREVTGTTNYPYASIMKVDGIWYTAFDSDVNATYYQGFEDESTSDNNALAKSNEKALADYSAMVEAGEFDYVDLDGDGSVSDNEKVIVAQFITNDFTMAGVSYY